MSAKPYFIGSTGIFLCGKPHISRSIFLYFRYSDIAGNRCGREKIAEWGANMQEKGGTVITNFVTKVIDIVKDCRRKSGTA